MNYTEILIEQAVAQSLAWDGDTLVDWVSGHRISLDGFVERRGVWFPYRFDSSLTSKSGRFTVLFERLGTKALVLDRGEILRELNRSYYFASTYEYPITFLTLPDGREAIAHCPKEYCRIDIELAETGECLTDISGRKPDDVFHSRLSTSQGGLWLASAGWVWHPFDVAAIWSVSTVLENPRLLDTDGIPLSFDSSVESLAFVDDDRLIAALGKESLSSEEAEEKLVMLSTRDGRRLCETKLASPAGTVVPFGDGLVLALYEHPRLLTIADGRAVMAWPHLSTGKQQTSILDHIDRVPNFAKHPTRPIFAISNEGKVTIVSMER
jgi:hypothetical protein